MYKCFRCGAIFEVPSKCVDRHGLDSEPYEIYYRCPHCGGEYDEVFECSNCGEWVFETELIDGFCESCSEDMENNYGE